MLGKDMKCEGGNVLKLTIPEQVEIEDACLQVLQVNLGDKTSQAVVERAVVEVAQRIGAVELALQVGDFEGLHKAARGVTAIGAQMGLTDLAKVSQDVMVCNGKRDFIALHAVIQRLVRLRDASLTAAINGMAQSS